ALLLERDQQAAPTGIHPGPDEDRRHEALARATRARHERHGIAVDASPEQRVDVGVAEALLRRRRLATDPYARDGHHLDAARRDDGERELAAAVTGSPELEDLDRAAPLLVLGDVAQDDHVVGHE